MTFPPLPQPKLALDLATPSKTELTQLAGYIPRWYTRPKTVAHLGTNYKLGDVALIGQMTLPLLLRHAANSKTDCRWCIA